MFTKKEPQRLFDEYDFTVTKTIFDPPALSLLPAIYQDEISGCWSVRYRGAEPSIFAYADVLDCRIVEKGVDSGAKELTPRERLAQIISNPARASRANAARRNLSPGLGVVVAVRTKEGVAKLEIPIGGQGLSRDSALYNRMLQLAANLKSEFDAMANSAMVGRTAVDAGEK